MIAPSTKKPQGHHERRRTDEAICSIQFCRDVLLSNADKYPGMEYGWGVRMRFDAS